VQTWLYERGYPAVTVFCTGEECRKPPALPGCISQGATRDEAGANVREAIAGYLESLEAHGEPIPPSITEEIVEV
jgi:antitoxin HicB